MALPLALHHVSLDVSDLDRSLAFYSGVLGLEKIPRPDLNVAGVWLGLGAAEIHLIVRDESYGDIGSSPSSINPAAQHVALRVDDYTSTVAHLRAAGLEVLETNAARGQCWIQDPDGHVLEFIVKR
ncbi:MAG: glyoxalase/bleomycin resistance protein [Actinomycetota bacterium]|jgi:catechol 2,3-dioxygenase-like lactoylglutathione lyase family enzyme